MNKLAAAIAAVALIGTPAFATPKKKPPPPPPAPVYSWTGWYVGGNVGYGWGNANTDLAANGQLHVAQHRVHSRGGLPPLWYY